MNSKVLIREARLDDATGILEIYKPFIEETAITFEEEVPLPEDFKQRMTDIWADSPYLVCTIDDQVVGYAYATTYRSRASYRWNREVSVYIHSQYLRINIASALYSALFEILKIQHIANLLAVITLPNEASIKLHESLGFKPCAVFNHVGYKFHNWHQVGWWELSLVEDENIKPVEPIPFSKVKDSTEITQILQKASTRINIS